MDHLTETDASRQSTRSALVFQAGIFLGAYLLFVVQPLIAKQILPWFGGGPSVWSACLLFFQLGLVAGYAYTHFTRRLGLSRQIAPNGIIAFHISNQYLDPRPVIRGLAKDSSLKVLEMVSHVDASRAAAWSTWALVTQDPVFVARVRSSTQPAPEAARSLVWTDAFSSLSSVVR